MPDCLTCNGIKEETYDIDCRVEGKVYTLGTKKRQNCFMEDKNIHR